MLGDFELTPTIPAHDIHRARQFYEGVLGFTPIREVSGGVIYGAAAGKSFLLYPTRFAGTAQHTLMSWQVNDIRAVVTQLRQRGVVFEEYDFPGLKTINGIAQIEGELGAWFKDTEGNILAIGQFT